MTRRLLLLTCTWVAFLALGLSGQQQSGQQASGQQGPPAASSAVFRGNVDAVELDVLVTDQRGQAVKDLKADDFVVDEDGVAQLLTSLSLIDIPIKPAAAAAQSASVEPDVQTNRKPDGRLYVFAMDDLAPGFDLRTRHFLRHFVAEQLTGDDVAALVYLGYGQPRNTQDFTSSSRLLLRAVDRITSSTGGVATEIVATSGGRSNLVDFSRIRAESLQALVESLAQIRGRRKVMLYFTHGLGLDVLDAFDRAGGTRSIAFDHLHAALSAATRGNVAIYPIDPKGLALDGSLEEAIDLRALAYSTGGRAIVNTNTIPDGLARIVSENSTYYVLGYSSTNSRREGRFRKVRVRVSRPGLVVRTRSGYLEPQKHAPRQEATTMPPMPNGLAKALEQPLADSAVPLQVFATAHRTGDRLASVLIVQDVDAGALGLTQTGDDLSGDVSIATLAVRFDGKVYGGKAQSVPVTIRHGGQGTIRVLSDITVPPGRYQLRVAGGTRDRAGSVMYDLDVPDYGKEPLVLSGLALSSAAAADAVIVDLSTRTLSGLPGPLTTTREFAPNESLTFYAEVYENLRKAAAHMVDVTATLRSADRGAIRTVQQQRPSTELADGNNGFIVSMPLDGTAPGDYVLHVDAKANVDHVDAVSREIPIRIR